MHTTSPESALRQARWHLLEHGDFPVEGIDERVARSWRRSLAAGLMPAGRTQETEHASGGELREVRAFNHELLAHSQPVMEYLFEQVRHSQGMVILADPRGTLMHTLGHADFLSKAERVALAAGASWNEQHRGTNAIGTALIEGSGIEIHGAEHFFDRNDFLTCTAVPIQSSRGEVMGILDISGDQRSGHAHTLGLVGMAARMIENRLLVASRRHPVRLHLHRRQEGIGTVAEGILALSNDGWIVGANRSGLALLGLTPADLGTLPLERRLDVRLDELLSRHRRRPGQPVLIHLHDGTPLFALVHAEPVALVAPVAAVAAAVSPVPDDALVLLDTGDPRWHAATEKARRVAGKAIPLLIQGESGVGKELFARATHDSGPRRKHPFVAINCAAMPEHLIEAELFGYAPGAFTGARREGSPGRLREAHGGTLFLDEIGDMPLALQTRLLRVLQERRVRRVGDVTEAPVDVRFLAATGVPADVAIREGRLRQDLFYRIGVITIDLPPLRERADDIPFLAQHFLERCSRVFPNKVETIDPRVIDLLTTYPWPGNVREMSNVIESIFALGASGRVVPEDLPEHLRQRPGRRGDTPAAGGPEALADAERRAVEQALRAARGNKSRAASILGISRTRLYNKLRLYGLDDGVPDK